ncbi:ABC transporter substrate-binding protein [Sinomonas sp. JGH33]|uniref:ABC transporter substrate-binding protein n=1 Tax=Sinomonas terricola TaxID=3110330 RepID=A0ABU5T8D2_9MICC|nr:ABC transporter substrate-binding protein [Sinomonas sp. JGH33]MEA5455696.1 ABC transporter substrate-binding protein [Sinomonas sp. JGH33]
MNQNRVRSRVAVAAAGLLATALVSGCAGGAQAKPKDSAAASGSTIMTPVAKSEVDKITWNVFEGEPQTIDPFKSADYTPNMINANLCENLLVQTPDSQIKPNLASKVSNPDPLHWVYDLRTDVKFWDGAPMTADDVVFSLQHNLTDKTSLYNYLFGNVDSIAATGANQVTVTLKAPDYLINDEFASYAGVVVEKKFFEAHAADFGSPASGVMCTGPFKYDKWAQGQSISVSRNDDYWNADLKPKAKKIDFTFVTDGAAITSGLLAGQIDGTFNVPTASLTQLKNTPVGTLSEGPAPFNMTMVWADPKGAGANPDLRKALQMAIDWNGVAKQTYAGTGQPLKLQTPSTVYGFAKTPLDSLEKSLPDPASAKYDDAKKIVDGLPADVKAKKITMVVPDAAETQQFGLAIKDAAGRIGLNFDLKVVPQTGYTNYLYDPATRAGVDILYTQFWPNVPNPLDWLVTTAVSGGLFNQYNYAGVDDLYAKAVATADADKRAQLVSDIETKLHDELLPMVPGIKLDNTVWMNKKITGAPAAFSYVYYPWAAHLGGAQ